jgi:hypothetical protein
MSKNHHLEAPILKIACAPRLPASGHPQNQQNRPSKQHSIKNKGYKGRRVNPSWLGSLSALHWYRNPLSNFILPPYHWINPYKSNCTSTLFQSIPVSSLNACITINHSKQQFTKKQGYKGTRATQSQLNSLSSECHNIKTLFHSYRSNSHGLTEIWRGPENKQDNLTIFNNQLATWNWFDLVDNF